MALCRIGRARSIDDLPLDSLTHINVAFGYIHEESFEIYPMDTEEKIFGELTNLKSRAPGLQVWLSLGGWTFNDPGPNQDVFSRIARSQENRYTFIKNLAKFLRTWSFDGVDIDWEWVSPAGST